MAPDHLTTAVEHGVGGEDQGFAAAGDPANWGKEVLGMRNRLLLWLPILTALALAALGAMDWGP
ncbi:MAG: hypothetical protein E6G19_12335 [Actinobacteria bacterium]|nr:MAG: hypothetical protein E6G19_12335 [Actinomycetota bacterium]